MESEVCVFVVLLCRLRDALAQEARNVRVPSERRVEHRLVVSRRDVYAIQPCQELDNQQVPAACRII